MDDTLDNSELLLQFGMKVGEDWCILGRFLSVKDHKLDVIDVECNDFKREGTQNVMHVEKPIKVSYFRCFSKCNIQSK